MFILHRIAASGDAALRGEAGNNGLAMHTLRKASLSALKIGAQIGALLALSKLGAALTAWLGLPLPGNMVGMVCLFALLATGLVRLEWVESGAGLLLRHLAFFFVPIAVGLMGLGQVWRTSGAALLAILAASAAVGILSSGYATSLFAASRRATAKAERPGPATSN
jgi:holin-like protein